MNPMQTTILILTIAVLVVGVLVFYLTAQIKSLKKNESEKVLMEWLKEMKSSVDKSSNTMSDQLKHQRESMDKQTKMIWERLDNASKVIGGVQKQLGEIGEFSKGMKDLSNVLRSPKLRGGLGEQGLYELLASALPKELFKTQYKFRNGGTCDAVIVTKDVVIPIDAKFPLENFRSMIEAESDDDRNKVKKVFIRDVKTRIDEIADKYILPEEGTAEYAIMYVPSENVFYELITNTPEIETYSKKRNVTLASPNTLYYILRSFLLAYKQYELQKHAGDILKALSGIQFEAEKFNDDLTVLDGHINRTSKSMDTVKNKFGKLVGKLSAVSSLGDGKKESTPLLEDG